MPEWLRTVPKRSLIILFLDLIGFYLSFSIVYFLRFNIWLDRDFFLLFLISIPIFIFFYILNIFNLERKTSVINQVIGTLISITLGSAFLTTLIYLFQIEIHTIALLQRAIFFGGMLLFSIWSSVVHAISYILKRNLKEKFYWVIIGTGEKAQSLFKDLKKQGWANAVQFLSVTEEVALPKDISDRLMGDISILKQQDFSNYRGIILSIDGRLSEEHLKYLMEIRLKGIVVYELADFYESYLLRVPVVYLQDGWITFSSGFDLIHHGIQLNFKRIFDIILSSIFFILFLPVSVLVALVIFLNDRENVFFVQKRTGLNGSSFNLYKFRTMIVDADKLGDAVTYKNDPRITRVGRIIRKSRLDELPQIINVLKGDMSFIGPRPESLELTKKYQAVIPYYDIRLMVKPGITGWAQIMYPATDSIEGAKRKLEYDIYYIKNYSMVLDFYIILRTIRIVLNLSGN